MSTVVRRTFRSIPHRNAHNTDGNRRAADPRPQTAQHRTTMAVAGVASSLIDQTLRDAAIIVTCDGPRTRIYCIYDDDAIDGGDANEDKLPLDPLSGDWAISPCARRTGLQAARLRSTARASRRATGPRSPSPKKRPLPQFLRPALSPTPRGSSAHDQRQRQHLYPLRRLRRRQHPQEHEGYNPAERALDLTALVEDWQTNMRGVQSWLPPAISRRSCLRFSIPAPMPLSAAGTSMSSTQPAMAMTAGSGPIPIRSVTP